MTTKEKLAGVVPAIVTPLTEHDKPDIGNLQRHIETLATESCHGVLLLGTTGEGPSMNMTERELIIEAGLEAADGMFIMAGTGTSSLTETIMLTRRAYELGVDATVVVPPFYYKKVTENGLSLFYQRLIDEAVPDTGLLMLYHIPQVSGIPITFELLERLLAQAGDRVAGIKDSSGNLDHARELCHRFPQLRVFVGNDRLLLKGLKAGAAGCITAGTNVLAPLAVAVYRAYQAGQDAEALQEPLTAARTILDQYQPFPPTCKSLLAARYGTSGWALRPPLTPLPNPDQETLYRELSKLDLPEQVAWLKGI